MLTYSNNYPEQLLAVLNTISQWNDERIKYFLASYIKLGSKRNELVGALAKYWSELWNKILQDSSFIEDDKKQLLFLLLKNNSIEDLLKLNNKENLSNYIASHEKILFEYEAEEEILKVLESLSQQGLNIKFKDISAFLPDRYNAILKRIYENNLYQINVNNIGSLLNEFEDNFEKKHFEQSNLTAIYESELEEIVDYIESDYYNTYIENIYSKLPNEQIEVEEYILKVLNEKKLKIEQREIFIRKQQTKIEDISKITSRNSTTLSFTTNKAEPTWKNIYTYFLSNGGDFDETLNNFLNEYGNYSELEMEDINLNIDKNQQDEFILKLISNDRISVDAYRAFIENSIPKNYIIPATFDYKIVNSEKVETLLNENFIPLDKVHFDILKVDIPELHIDLLVRDWNSVNEFLEENEIDTDDKLLVLRNFKLLDKQKLSFIKIHVGESDLEENEDLGSEIIEIILSNKNESEIQNLLDNNVIKRLIRIAESNENQIELIIIFKNSLSKDDIISIQESFPSKLKIHPKSQLVLDNKELYQNYVETLRQKGIAGEMKINKHNQLRVWLLDYMK